MYAVIDHYDSFTYNLVHQFRRATPDEVAVFRSDAFSAGTLERLPLKGLILSPGPGGPDEYPESIALVRRLAGKVPILGVCLGHEILLSAFGGAIRRAKRMMHGKRDELLLDGRGCFRRLPSPSTFMRYHSLVADPALPDCLEATAWSRDGDIMGVRHREHPIEGVQFHPESVGSESGDRVVANFLSYRREPFPLKATLSRLLAGENLEQETARGFMTEMAEGNLSDPQLAGFLCAIEAKGPTAAEIAGCVSVLRDRLLPIDAGGPTLDIVGCGGDNSGSFNLSSMAALTAAACGQPVAKHGGRAVSSFSGAADFFAALGYPLDIPPRAAEHLIRETGFAFLFAPLYHSAMRHAVTARRELAVKTIMNLLGPLSNPAGAPYQVMGVPTMALLEPMAEAAMLLGGERVMTIASEDGLDEFSTFAPTHCVLAGRGEKTRRFVFDFAEAGIVPAEAGALKGGTAEDNAAIARRLMSGSERGGLLDAVCLNAGAGLFVTGAAASIADGYGLAKQAFAGGAVAAKVAEVLALAQSLADSRKA